MQAPQAGPSAPQAGASTPSGAEADTSKVEPHPVSRLPPQYFQPPDAFDAVHHMLESLPEQLSEAYVQGQIQQTQLVLDSINSQLSARVMRSYGAFVHGMAQVPRLASARAASRAACASCASCASCSARAACAPMASFAACAAATAASAPIPGWLRPVSQPDGRGA